jgi:hypothetical protein
MTEQRQRGLSDDLANAERKKTLRVGQGEPTWLKGRLVENQRFTPNQERQIAHKLGKQPRGFIVVGARFVDNNALPGNNAYSLFMRRWDGQIANMIVTSDGSQDLIYDIWFW